MRIDLRLSQGEIFYTQCFIHTSTDVLSLCILLTHLVNFFSVLSSSLSNVSPFSSLLFSPHPPKGSPEIVTPLNESVITNIIVGVGEDAEFRCNFLAYPNASTRWFRVMGQMRDELDVNANGRYQVGENGTLQLINVRVNDAGMYSCEVSNEFGNDTRMQNLMIIVGKSVKITYCVSVWVCSPLHLP